MSLPAFDRIESPGKRLRELSTGTHLPLEQPARDELREELAASSPRCGGKSPSPTPPRTVRF